MILKYLGVLKNRLTRGQRNILVVNIKRMDIKSSNNEFVLNPKQYLIRYQMILELDAGGKPSTCVSAGETRRAEIQRKRRNA